MKSFRLRLAIVLYINISLFNVSQLMAQNATINLNSEKQLVRGFGGINHPVWIGDLTTDQVNTAFGNGTGQIGMTVLRIFIDHNKSSWSGELSTAKKAIEMGAIVFASPWNPPASMTEVVDGDKRLRYDMYDEYTAHLNEFGTYMKDNGVDLYAISVQNEPDYAHDWTWWTPEEMLKFMRENASAIQNRVIAPESFQYRKVMSDPILNDPVALANMDILGAHLYGTQVSDFPYPLFKEKGAGKELWMTEVYTESSNDADLWPLALDVAYNIHNSMVEAEFNVYVWWYIRRSYGMIKEDSQISKRGYCMAHFSKFVRPGYIRVDATKNPTTDVYVSAYKGGDSVVVVAVNRSNSSKTVSFSLSGSTASTLTRYTTSANKSLANDGTVSVSDGSFTVDLDAQSISTFCGNTGNIPDAPQEPYNNEPHQIPGRIEAQLYDLGGEGKAYHEVNSNGNEGLADFRDDQVDIETTGDNSGLYNICYVLQGEWLEYTVDVTATGTYDFDLRMSADGDGKGLHIEMDGVNESGTVTVPNTGGWQTWTTVTVKGIDLTEGQHVMRISFDTDYMNLNFVEFKIPTGVKNLANNKLPRNPISADGLQIKLNGLFNYRIIDIRGSIVAVGNGIDALKVGTGLSPGVYLLCVKNKIGNFVRKIVKK